MDPTILADAYILTEKDVPGASLHERDPGLLTVPELKRWLACRGASRRGRKADLVLRVNEYKAAGLDKNVVDPDGGANVERKRAKLLESGLHKDSPNVRYAVPLPEAGWVRSLGSVPAVSFATIYRHFMERSLEVVVGLEAGGASTGDDGGESDTDVFSSFRGIDKGYRFFKDGHVQQILFNDLNGDERYCYVRCKVLPSMKKGMTYDTRVCLTRTGLVHVAYCVCTAGLAGCCNHVAALLYALEEFVRLGLREEPESPTSRLCTWNRPRARTVPPCKVEDVRLHRAKFMPVGDRKRSRGPKALYNPVPPSKRLVNPVEVDELKDNLRVAYQHSLATATEARRESLKRYGPSTLQTALADTSDSSSDSEASSGHCHSSSDSSSSSSDLEDPSVILPTAPHAAEADPCSLDEFYERNVVVTPAAQRRIEEQTRAQASSALWHSERRKRVTATLCKRVACRQSDDFTAILCDKLAGTFKGNTFTRYGRLHEAHALDHYLQLKKEQQPGFSIKPTGLVIMEENPWLAASPDSIAADPAAGSGVVEVKCPYRCQEVTLREAAKQSSFCLKVCDGGALTLKKGHAYMYQVQFQMAVTGCRWADLVVWTPTEVHVERVEQDVTFRTMLPKLRKFYFEHLLPALYSEIL